MPAAPAMQAGSGSKKGAEGTVVVSSLVVLALWSYRKLIEPHTVGGRAAEPALRQIIGMEPKPAPAPQFAIAFGFVFFTLSVTAMAAPELASSFAILIAVGYTLTNGASIFTDISQQVSAKTATPAAKPAAGR